MDFQDKIKVFSERVMGLKDSILTEEATKNAFIMPFIQLLGYDVFNPLEVIPEFTADIGIKKGEKVDYAIQKDGELTIIIECKHWQDTLTLHNTQLQRYFNVTKARIAILTNGIVYKFYSDLKETNKLDENPFLELDLENPKDYVINELRKFQKTGFDVDKIIDTASELKYSTTIRSLIIKEFDDPSEEFVKYFAKQVYPGRLTEKVMIQFQNIVKKTVNQVFKDQVNERLTSALKKEEEAIAAEPAPAEEEDNGIVTTQHELDAFQIVRSIVRVAVDVSRVTMRDKQTYCGILLDDNNRKPICRFWFNSAKWYLSIFDKDKKEDKVQIEALDDIFKYADRLIETAKSY